MKMQTIPVTFSWPLCMHSSHVISCFAAWEKSLKDRWNAKSVYVVGSATASLGKESREDEGSNPRLGGCGLIFRSYTIQNL